MADQVGLTASVITITGCICLAFQWLFTWGRFFYYDVENDVKALQDLLHGTTVFLNEVSSRNPISPNPHLDVTITCARNVVTQLNHTLHQILDVRNGSRLRWRLLWLRHSSNIGILQLRLRNLKDEIVSMSNAKSAKETEKTLLSITYDRRRDITTLQDTSSNLDRKLDALRTDLSLNNQMVSLEVQTAMRMLNFTPYIGPLEGISYRPIIPYQGLLAGRFAQTSIPTNSLQDLSDQVTPRKEDDQATYLARVQPASAFELSQTFKPHKYVGRFKVPPVLVTAYYQESCSYNECSNRYQILYFQSEERWVKFSISLEIPRSSSFWDITRVTRQQRAIQNGIDHFCVPSSLVERLRKWLNQDGAHIKDNTLIKLRLTDDNTCTTSEQIVASQSKTSRSIVSEIKEPALLIQRKLFSWIRHIDVPRYSEAEVFLWAILDLPGRFAVYLGDRLVQEIKSIEQAPSAIFCYNIQLLHSLRGVPEVLELVGLTTDEGQQRIKSYLVEWPNTQCQLLLHRASSSVFPWVTIETWTRRLIRAIHAVHSRFFVVGTLRCQRPPILVDALDNIYLHTFEHGLRINGTASPFYPPEYHHFARRYAGFPSQIDEPVVNPAYDLYQLGQILWILAESWSTGQSALALKEWFYKAPDSWPGGLYTGPYPLPCLSTKVPKYYRDIVDSCLARNPHERLPCKELLSMFPRSQNNMDQGTSIPSPAPMTVEAMQNCRISANACNICRKQIISQSYSCTICANSDFDVCQKCFNEGKHCMDPSHLLVEVAIGELFPTKTRYHSSVNQLGTRTVIEAE